MYLISSSEFQGFCEKQHAWKEHKVATTNNIAMQRKHLQENKTEWSHCSENLIVQALLFT